MSIFSPSDKYTEVLTEAYYGKKPEFKRIEELLEVIIKRCHELHNGSVISTNSNINNSKELKEIEKLFEKAFGMKEMHLTFYIFTLTSTGMNFAKNAFTIPNFLTYFKKKENGMSNDNDLVCNVWVDTNLVTVLDLNAKELMAVILHEIGHCYDASLFAFLSKIPLGLTADKNAFNFKGLPGALLINTALGALKWEKYLHEFDKAIQKFIEENKVVAVFLNSITIFLQEFFVNLSVFAPNILSIPKLGIDYVLKMLLPRNIFGYSNEKYADSFATAYGYGKEVMIFNNKCQQKKGHIIFDAGQHIPILNVGLDFINLTNTLVVLPIDPHPSAPTRMQSQINKLRRDLKDPNLDPKIKKELLSQLDDMEYYADQLLSSEENLKKGRIFTMLYNRAIMKVFKGKFDLRELLEIVHSREV